MSQSTSSNQTATSELSLTVQNGKVTASSRDIAKRFDKEHRNVIRAIESLDCSKDFALLNFEQGYYTLPQTGNQKHTCYEITRDGFAFLCMGFTGKKAAKWKEAYINAFNEMEKKILADSSYSARKTTLLESEIKEGASLLTQVMGKEELTDQQRWQLGLTLIEEIYGVGTAALLGREAIPQLEGMRSTVRLGHHSSTCVLVTDIDNRGNNGLLIGMWWRLAFVENCCNVGGSYGCSLTELYQAFCRWFASKVGTEQKISFEIFTDSFSGEFSFVEFLGRPWCLGVALKEEVKS